MNKEVESEEIVGSLILYLTENDKRWNMKGMQMSQGSYNNVIMMTIYGGNEGLISGCWLITECNVVAKYSDSV